MGSLFSIESEHNNIQRTTNFRSENHNSLPITEQYRTERIPLEQKINQLPLIKKTQPVRNPFKLDKESVKLIEIGEFNDLLAISFSFDSDCEGSISLYQNTSQLENPEETGKLFTNDCVLEESFLLGKNHQYISKPFIYKHPPLNNKNVTEDAIIYPLVICFNRSNHEKNTTEKYVDSMCVYFSIKNIEDKFYAKEIQRTVIVGKKILLIKDWFDSGQPTYSKDQTHDNLKKKSTDCVICMEKLCNITIFPCLHMALCDDCAEYIRNNSMSCPICRCKIIEFWKTN